MAGRRDQRTDGKSVTPEEKKTVTAVLKEVVAFAISANSGKFLSKDDARRLLDIVIEGAKHLDLALDVRTEKQIREAQANPEPLTQEQRDEGRMIATEVNFDRTLAFERDAEQRRAALDANIKQLTKVFEQRHEGTDPERRDELRAELQERFVQLREKLADELDAKFERMMNERDDPSR